MKINVELLLQMRKAKAWSQEELATASGLNLRTIQRIEKEAMASLQSMKALASVFDVNMQDLEYEELSLISELLGKKVAITTSYIGALYTVKGKVTEIHAPWLKLAHEKKNDPIYINISQIVQIAPL